MTARLQKREGAVWCRAPSQCGFRLRVVAIGRTSQILRERRGRWGSQEPKERLGHREQRALREHREPLGHRERPASGAYRERRRPVRGC